MKTRRRTWLALALAAALAAGSPAWAAGGRFMPGGGGWGGGLLGQMWAWLAATWQSAPKDDRATIDPWGSPAAGATADTDARSTIDPDGTPASATDPITTETDHRAGIDPNG
jgi:hypothetical protein